MPEMNLFEIFLKEKVVNLQVAILNFGVHGLMARFEGWLRKNDIIAESAEKFKREEYINSTTESRVKIDKGR